MIHLQPKYQEGYGDVVIDYRTAFIVDSFISGTMPLNREIHSMLEQTSVLDALASIVETIVVHQKLVMVPMWPLADGSVGESYEEIRVILSPDRQLGAYFYALDAAHESDHSDLTKDDIENFHKDITRMPTMYEAIKRGLALRMPYNISEDSTKRSRYADFLYNTLGAISDTAREDIDLLNKYNEDFFSLDVPIIFNYILEKSSNKNEIIPRALEFRQTKEAEAFRNRLSQLDEAASIDDRKTVIEITREVDDAIKALRKKIEQPTLELDIGFPLSVALSVRPLIEIMRRISGRRKRHLLFIEQLYKSAKQARSVRRHLGKLL